MYKGTLHTIAQRKTLVACCPGSILLRIELQESKTEVYRYLDADNRGHVDVFATEQGELVYADDIDLTVACADSLLTWLDALGLRSSEPLPDADDTLNPAAIRVELALATEAVAYLRSTGDTGDTALAATIAANIPTLERYAT